MISAERAAEILRLYHAEKWKPGTVARQLGVHHATVRRVLAQAGQAPGLASARPSIADPFVELIRTTLEKYPTLRASRFYAMARSVGTRAAPITSGTWWPATGRRRRPRRTCGCVLCRGSRRRWTEGTSASCASGAPSGHCGRS